VLGKVYPDALPRVNDLATLLKSQGRYEDTKEMLRQALDGREKAPGKEHPDTPSTVNDLATLLKSQERTVGSV